MNKEELLKAIEQKRQAIWPTDTGEMAPATVPNNLEQGWLNALAWMKRYINSLPAEKQSNSLDKFIHSLLETYPTNKKEVPTEALNDYHQGLICGARKVYNWILESAIDGCHIKRNGYTQVNVLNGFSTTCEAIQKFKDGDKVKVIIIKEDEQ